MCRLSPIPLRVLYSVWVPDFFIVRSSPQESGAVRDQSDVDLIV